MNPQAKARRYVQLALVVGFLAPAYEYISYVFTHRGDLFFEATVVLGLIAFTVIMPLVWFFGLLVIQLASTVVHAIFGRGVPLSEWQNATFQGLWSLPVAAAAGATTWFVYSIGRFGGWPDDLVFGAVANVIGAWCCCTVFWNWIRLIRANKRLT